jgi:hypothetical protein
MSELQNEETDLDVTETEVIENQEIESDLATDSDSQHEQKAVDETANQEAIQKAINKKHFETQQAKRDLDAANKRIAEFEDKQRQQLAAQMANVAPMPDAFDDDYAEKMQARDSQIAQKAQFDAQQATYNEQKRFQQQEADNKAQLDLRSKVESYGKRTKDLGIGQEEMQAAGNTVAQYGISDDLTMAILADTDGPLITKYLAANPVELSTLSTMNPVQAAMHLERNVRGKATALRPKTTNAPAPADNLRGGANAKGVQYKNISGAKFE